MPKEAGYGVMFSPEGVIVEHRYCQCGHCGMQFRVGRDVPQDQIGDFCRNCYTPICSKCAGKVCVPFAKWIDTVEQKEYIRMQNNKALGF